MTLALEGKEFFSIGEASQLTQVPPYVLRYWESEFKLLRPMRRESGQRKYSRKDVETILSIKDLLYQRKFTIAGARRVLLEEKRAKPEQLKIELEESGAAVELLREARAELEAMAQILKS